MAYTKITPRARSGITGISTEVDLDADGEDGEVSCWISPPERVAAITIAVHALSGYSGDIEYTVEACCNTTSVIGDDGTGGYWDPIEKDKDSYTDDNVFMLTNCVTGIRVTAKTGKINVCFVG
mgnify:CR=1 FL=1